jgi:hypothetical protein
MKDDVIGEQRVEWVPVVVAVEEFVPGPGPRGGVMTAESTSAPEQIGFRAEHDRNVDRSAFCHLVGVTDTDEFYRDLLGMNVVLYQWI